MKYTFFPKADKKNVNGEVAIYCKIKVNGNITSFPTQKYVDPIKWKANRQFKTSKKLEEKAIRIYLNDIATDLEKIEAEFQKEGKGYNAQMIKNKLFGVGEINKNKSLLEVWEEHRIDFLNKAKCGQVKKQSYLKYNSVKLKLEDFLKTKHRLSDIPMLSLNDKFQKDFHLYLSGKLSHNIAIKYLVLFRCVVKFAVDNHSIDSYPFREYKTKLEKKDKTYLSEEEIVLITNKKMASERLNVVRDCFLFSIYTGYCFADISELTPANMQRIGQDVIITKNREKTTVQAKVRLVAKAIALVEKYSNNIDCIVSGKLFPMKSNQKMNEYLKEIANVCGIEKNLTWHVARFSFAKICMENGMDIKVLSEALGHTNIAQTIHYCGQFSNKSVIREMSKLESVFA